MNVKFTLTFKTPDVLDQIAPQEGLESDIQETMETFARKFVAWGERITIEFDSEKGTAMARRCE